MALRIPALLALLCATLAATAPAMADPAGGEAIYRQRCQMCHGKPGTPSPLGPSLSGVIGRKAGSTTFNHSPALRQSGIVWSRAALDRFLAAPQKAVPGTKMVIALPDPAQRKAVLDFLARLPR